MPATRSSVNLVDHLGLHSGGLWIHAAPVGGYKTSLALMVADQELCRRDVHFLGNEESLASLQRRIIRPRCLGPQIEGTTFSYVHGQNLSAMLDSLRADEEPQRPLVIVDHFANARDVQVLKQFAMEYNALVLTTYQSPRRGGPPPSMMLTGDIITEMPERPQELRGTVYIRKSREGGPNESPFEVWFVAQMFRDTKPARSRWQRLLEIDLLELHLDDA